MRSVVVGLIYDAERRATLGTTLNIKWDGNNR